MGYTGVPSRACKQCRNRRVKCDETRPRCGYCHRAGLECGDYPNEHDIIFRDETEVVKRRAANVLAKRSQEKPAPATTVAPYQPPLPFVQHLCCPIEYQAVTFFFSYHIEIGQRPFGQGSLLAVKEYWHHAKDSSFLFSAITAAGLMALSNHAPRQDLHERACKSYSVALRKAATAMQHSKDALSGETLFACLILAFYELMSSGKNSVLGYVKHIVGASALVRLRGPDQFRDGLSKRLYRATRTQLFLSQSQAGNPIHDFPIEQLDQDRDHIDDYIVQRLSVIAIKVPTIRARANELLLGSGHTLGDGPIKALQDEAQGIDAELDDWYATLPDNWQPSVITAYAPTEKRTPQDPNEFRPGRIDRYSSLTISETVSQYRIFRIYTNGVVARCALATSDSATFTSACNEIQYLVDGICASAACFLGCHVPKLESTTAVDVEQSIMCRDKNTSLNSSLSWPLFLARSTECIPISQRNWIDRMLEQLGKREGLCQVQLFRQARPGLIEGRILWLEEEER